jgi:L-2,4-diaminobutyrate decarboxylase
MAQTNDDKDWTFNELEEALQTALPVLDRYLQESRAGRDTVVRLRPVSEIVEELDLKRWLADGKMNAQGFATFLSHYLSNSTRMHHPGYMAHQVAVPGLPSALADFVHGATNNPMAIYEMGPAAAAIELVVIDWMLEKVGWKNGSGVLTHGGSLANLTGLLAARATAFPKVWDEGITEPLAIIAPAGAHYSIKRASSILGLGGNSVYAVDVDEREVVQPDKLPATLKKVADDGRRVVALVANACATSTGLHDPLEEIGAFCREAGIWLHVDGAHGASALVSEKERKHLRGVEMADSLSWDAHKMLRTSGLCTAIVFRDNRSLDRAFHQEASYLFYGDEGQGVDLIQRTVECTKAPLGVKLFLTLAWRGEQGLALYVEEQYELTRKIHQRIQSRKGFECPYVPESNILCFRYGDDNNRQVTIRERLLAEGRFYITSTEIHGRRYLRLTLMSPQTTEETVEEMLDAIERIAVEADDPPAS